MTVGL